jgi:hypothetical protein
MGDSEEPYSAPWSPKPSEDADAEWSSFFAVDENLESVDAETTLLGKRKHDESSSRSDRLDMENTESTSARMAFEYKILLEPEVSDIELTPGTWTVSNVEISPCDMATSNTPGVSFNVLTAAAQDNASIVGTVSAPPPPEPDTVPPTEADQGLQAAVVWFPEAGSEPAPATGSSSGGGGGGASKNITKAQRMAEVFKGSKMSKKRLAHFCIKTLCTMSQQGHPLGTMAVQVVNQTPEYLDFRLLDYGRLAIRTTFGSFNAALARMNREEDYNTDMDNNLRTIDQIVSGNRAPEGTPERTELDRSWNAWKTATLKQAGVVKISNPPPGTYKSGQEWVSTLTVFRLSFKGFIENDEATQVAVMESVQRLCSEMQI